MQALDEPLQHDKRRGVMFGGPEQVSHHDLGIAVPLGTARC